MANPVFCSLFEVILVHIRLRICVFRRRKCKMLLTLWIELLNSEKENLGPPYLHYEYPSSVVRHGKWPRRYFSGAGKALIVPNDRKRCSSYSSPQIFSGHRVAFYYTDSELDLSPVDAHFHTRTAPLHSFQYRD